jgi:2-phosphosulfolactate phosphatase
MNHLETCLSPDLLHLHALEGKIVVVVDILRATSCMVSGLATGVDKIVPVTSFEQCIPYMEQGFLSAGERGGAKLEGCHMGNSPFEYMSDAAKGRSVVMTTTNGTKAIHLSKGAYRIVAGAFLNLPALAHALGQSGRDVVICCAGWQGRFSAEDTLFAGALAIALEGTHSTDCDATEAAKVLYRQAQDNLEAALRQTAHAKRLGRLGVEKDMGFCATIGMFNIIPVLHGEELLASTVI